MQLDTPTLLATITITYFAGAIVLGILALALRSYPGHIRGSWALWSVAMLLSGTCAILFGLRGAVPDVLSIVVANALMLIGFGIRPNALSMLNGRGLAYPWLPVMAALIWLGFYWLPWFKDEVSLRVLFVNGLAILAISLCIRECWRQKKETQFSSWFLMSIFSMDVAIRLGVITIYFNSEFQSLKDAFQTPSFTIILIVLLFTIIFKVVGLGIAVFEQMKWHFQEQAFNDPLTGLLNRRSFMETAEAELNRKTDGARSYALITLEIDDLPGIKSRFGPSMGDALLRLQGRICSKTISGSSIVGRIRETQFALFVPHSDKAGACTIANRISRSMAVEGTRASGSQLAITVSAGIFCGDTRTTFRRALEIADHCLGHAKSVGGNQVLTHGDLTDGPLKTETAPSPFAPNRQTAA